MVSTVSTVTSTLQANYGLYSFSLLLLRLYGYGLLLQWSSTATLFFGYALLQLQSFTATASTTMMFSGYVLLQLQSSTAMAYYSYDHLQLRLSRIFYGYVSLRLRVFYATTVSKTSFSSFRGLVVSRK
jgi:hypothetical protein